jgi:hypothetical protein
MHIGKEKLKQGNLCHDNNNREFIPELVQFSTTPLQGVGWWNYNSTIFNLGIQWSA